MNWKTETAGETKIHILESSFPIIVKILEKKGEFRLISHIPETIPQEEPYATLQDAKDIGELKTLQAEANWRRAKGTELLNEYPIDEKKLDFNEKKLQKTEDKFQNLIDKVANE